MNPSSSSRNPTEDGARDDFLKQFAVEPNTVVFKFAGKEIFVPKYNGIVWWFPDHREDAPILQTFLVWVFTIVNTMQTLCIFIWPILLIVRFGLVRSILALFLTIPLALNMEETFGKSYGTAHASFNILFLTFRLAAWYTSQNSVQESNSTGWVFGSLGFIIVLFTVGTIYCNVEIMIGRTWFALISSYYQLFQWLIELKQWIA